MNIQNIQIAQGLLRAVDGKVNSVKGNIYAESDASLQAINLPEAQNNEILSDNSNVSKKQADALQIIDPPFFPLGNTQGIYSVLIQAGNDGSSLSDAEQPQEASGADSVAVGLQIAAGDDEPIKEHMPETKEKILPGSVLDFKV